MCYTYFAGVTDPVYACQMYNLAHSPKPMIMRNVFLFIALCIVFCGCSDDDNSVTTKATERTVLVYLAADNDLARFALLDVQEMIAGMEAVDDTRYNLLVYMDTGTDPQLFRLGKNSKGEVERQVIRNYSAQNSLDTRVMKDIFSDAFTAYPAGNYGLVLWSHADGWLKSPSSSTRYFGQDGIHSMDISELKKALQSAPHFEYIYFEACFMMGVEVVYELRDCADYFLGSPTETPGPGAPYDLILPAMLAGSSSVTTLADIYYKDYLARYNGGIGLTNDNWTAGASIAVVRSSALDELATATRRLLPLYLSEGEEASRTGIMCYDNRSSRYHYDMDGLMRSLTQENEDYRQWRASFDKAVIYYHTTEQNYSKYARMFSMKDSQGLSMYIPRSSQTNLLPYYQTYAWYTDGGWQAAGW